MRKLITLILLVVAITGLSASVSFQQTRGDLLVSYHNYEASFDQLRYSATIALPALSAEAEVISSSYDIYDQNNNFLRNETMRSDDNAEIVNSFVMRELYGHRLEFDLIKRNRNETAVLSNMEIKVIAVDPIDAPTEISPAFAPIYRSITGNYQESYLYLAEVAPSKMLIIANEGLHESMQIFMNWKNSCGIETDLFSITEAGTNKEAIREFIAGRYNNEETRPDYLVIVGDVDDSFAFPGFYIESPSTSALNVSDAPYSLIDGDDYFPELITGRFSVDTEMELVTMINKVLFYEKTPYMENPDWFESATLIAGNYADEPPIPTTPVETSQWLAEKLDHYGYGTIEEFYYPGLYPGTQEILNSINAGKGLVTYRGWGNANGWHFPEFKRQHIDQLNNGVMLPVITSFVCNTGDYGNIDVDPCFGEKLVRAGTPSSPRGAVIFIGPSDLHTSTKYNNSLFSGFYQGMLNEDNYTFGTAALRSKYELYDNFPNQREIGEDAEFYFYVYNIMGDPSLVMRTKTPTPINCALPAEIGLGTNFLDINVDGADGAIISAVKDGEIIARAIIDGGATTLYFEPQSVGTIEVTITKVNRIPFIGTVNVVDDSVDLGISNLTTTNIIAGSDVDITVELTNFGTSEASIVTAELTSNDGMVTINVASGDFGTIVAGGTATANYNVTIDAVCQDCHPLSFTLTMSDGSVGKFELINNSIIFEITEIFVDGDGVLDPGDVAAVGVEVRNFGTIDVTSLTATAVSLSDAILLSDTLLEYGNINADGLATAQLGITVDPDCYVGRLISFRLDFEDGEGQTCSAVYTTEVGTVATTDPTGSDSYGYYAYDNTDMDNEGVAFVETPEYEWHVVDPNDGGDGEVLLLSDDDSEVINLPFNFKYYGQNNDLITVCTNGWIAFEETEVTDFTNWNIPAALGPYGMVAAYWDDIVGELLIPADNIHADVRISYKHFVDEGAFVLQWNEAWNSDNDISVIKFEIVLYDPTVVPTSTGDGVIQVNYNTIDNPDVGGNFATVGIENYTQTVGLAYTYAGYYADSAAPLTDGLAIRFTTNAPDQFVGTGDDETAPLALNLIGNYPNPFNPTTTISFSTVNAEQNVELNVYNVKGQKVKTLVNDKLTAGTHSVVWDGKDNAGHSVVSGVYFYKLSDEVSSFNGKCLLLK